MKYLRLLKKLSLKSNHHQHKMACLLVRGGRIIGRGYNMVKSHPDSPHKCFKQIHAEFHAVLNAGYDVENATAYIFREKKDGTLALARPCRHCMVFLIKNGVKEIVYSFDNSHKKERIA
jgi:deoxycytidylate deaminase